MSRRILTMTALLAGALTASATVTVQGWWHLDSTQPITDSSGNGRTFGNAYSTAPAAGGSVAALLVNNGAGGPLDSTGWTSTQCIQLGVGVGGKRQSAMWGIGYNPPPQNYGIEIWVLPQDNGIAGGSGGWIFSSGSSGGVALRINAPSGSPSYIDAFIIGPGTTIGNQVIIDTNRWMHLAIVNAGGVLTFYTNGIPCGASVTSGATAPGGDVYIGTPSDNQAYYGYLDEARMFTFAAGAFSTSDLLLRAAGPNIAVQPQSATVWTGGALALNVVASFDNSVTYQWWTNGMLAVGDTGPTLYLPVLTSAFNGEKCSCVLSSGGISVTSAVATVTVVSPNTSNVNAYRNAIMGEATLAGYYPVDHCTGTTISNLFHAPSLYDGALELGGWYDGRTDRSFGERALSLELNGDVQIPINNPAYEFPTGNGTIEALVFLDQSPPSNPTIFSEGYDNNAGTCYSFQASADGSSLIFSGGAETVSWLVPQNLIGRLAHVAVVLDSGVNVTAYADGQALATQTIPSGLGVTGGSAWIGALGTSVTTYRWSGTIDELSIYGSALSAASVQNHYTKYFYGTNTAPPGIASQPVSKTLYAGSSPTLTVVASGALPLTYQWTSNSVPIPGATTPTLSLTNASTAFSATYQLTIQNTFGSTNTQPIALSFVAPPAGYPAMVMKDSPSAYWRLNEASGPTVIDYAGENNGTYTASGVTYGAPSFQGEPGTAVTFNGSSGRGVIPYTTALNPATPFSIEFWAQPQPYTPGGNWTSPFSSMNRPARNGGYEFYMGGNYNGFEFHTAAGGGYNMITGDGNTATPPNWYYVVGIFDGFNIYCYVNGQPASVVFSDNNVSEGTPPFTPNTVAPLYIGSRSDNVRYFNGSMADFAFYNYALSYEQVSNHWSIMYSPAHVVTQPIGVTNVEGSTITLTSVFSGLPNTYQWYKAGSALTPTDNFDNTPHYSQDVTNAGLTIAQTQPSDSGLYYVVASNPLGGAQSIAVNVLITPDTNAPVVSAVQALGTPNAAGPTPFLVKVTFNKRIDPSLAAVAANYVFSPHVTVNQATPRGDLQATQFGTDWKTVFLQTSGLTPGQKYTLTVSGIKDQAETPNIIVPAPVSFWAPPLTQGAVWWDYYYEITPQSVGSLVGNANYPYAPTTNSFMTAFDTDQITDGDLNNNLAFGALGDNYGDSLSGWITPTVTGDYTFFLASDDSSELLLSTDNTAANAQMIAYESGCCHGFLDTTNNPYPPQTSQPQHLLANTPYFIQALHTEGGGGDYVKVAWRISTDPTPSVSLKPIPAQYLSAFVLLPPHFNAPVFANGQLTLSWTGLATLLESSDLKTWTPVPGNPASPFTVTPGATPHMYYWLKQ